MRIKIFVTGVLLNRWGENLFKVEQTMHHLSDKKWKEHWQSFLGNMVYQPDKPSFEDAVLAIEELTLNKMHTVL